MQHKPIAFVTGANGFIGPRLTEKLVTLGYHVRILVRRPVQSARFSDQVEVLRGDLSDNALLGKGVRGTEVVFHLAAKLHLHNPTPELRKDYEQVNVAAACRVAAISNAAKVPRFVFYSTINVYGSTQFGQVFDEQSPLNPESWYAQTKADAEKLVLEQAPAVVLRLAAVYGNGMKGNYPRLLKALQTGRFVMVGSGFNRRTLVHVDDVCDASVAAATHPDALGRIYNVTDGQVHTLGEVIGAMCAAQGLKAPRFKIPAEPVRKAVGFFEDIFGFMGVKPPFNRSTVDKFTEDMAVSGDKIQRELGFKPRYDLLTGWREGVAS